MRTAHHLHLYRDAINAAVDVDPLNLTISVGPKNGVVADHDFVFYAESLDQLLELGYAIVNQCRKLQIAATEADLATLPPFEPASAAVEPQYAINDTVDHALAAINSDLEKIGY